MGRFVRECELGVIQKKKKKIARRGRPPLALQYHAGIGVRSAAPAPAARAMASRSRLGPIACFWPACRPVCAGSGKPKAAKQLAVHSERACVREPSQGAASSEKHGRTHACTRPCSSCCPPASSAGAERHSRPNQHAPRRGAGALLAVRLRSCSCNAALGIGCRRGARR